MSDNATVPISPQSQDEFIHYFMVNYGNRVESVERTIVAGDATITKVIKLLVPGQEAGGLK